jgi:hypothetical protein
MRVSASLAARLGALTLTDRMNPTMSDLILKSNGSAEEDYDVISDGRLVGHIFKPAAAPVGTPWMWVAFRRRTGYAATRETAMQAFAIVWYG